MCGILPQLPVDAAVPEDVRAEVPHGAGLQRDHPRVQDVALLIPCFYSGTNALQLNKERKTFIGHVKNIKSAYALRSFRIRENMLRCRI
jgi:hypothetical protein